MENHGLLHVYYGSGKGKTTAALGLMLRALGHGHRTVLVQFLKGLPSGEITVLKQMPGVVVLRGQYGEKFYFQMNDEEKLETKRIHDAHLIQALHLAKQGMCDLLVLDEGLDAYTLNSLDNKLLEELINLKENRPEIVITGHQPVEWIMERADYITEMVSHRHPYDKGQEARKGIEY